MSILQRLSFNQMTADPWSLEEAVANCARSGISYIGVWRHKLDGNAIKASALIRSAGLRVSSLCRGGWFSAPTAEERRNRIADNRMRYSTMMFGRTRMIGYCNVSSGALPNTFRDHIESVRPINTGKRRSRQFRPIEVFPHALGLVRSVSGEGRRALCAGREI